MITLKNIPEWRFDFSDEWQEKTLGEICEFSRGGNLSKNNLAEFGTPCILYGELYTTYGAITKNIKSFTDIDKNNLILGKFGDVLMPLSGETAEDISVATCVLVDGVAYGGDLLVLRPSKENDGRFISYLINSKLKLKIAKIAQGKTIVHINAKEIKKISCRVPSLEEQKKIAEYFSTLDNVIDAEEKILSGFKEMKRGLLQKLFV